MWYETLKMLIENGRTNRMAEMLDAYKAAGMITQEQYNELLEMLNEEGK